MNGFERRKDQSKENIRRAAYELFNKFGISKVSVNDIARKANVSQVTIYNHFGSKQDLIQDWIISIRDEFTEQLKSILFSEKPYMEKLEDTFKSMTGLMKIKHLEVSDLEIQHDPEIARLFESVWDEIKGLFINFIKEGKSKGYLYPELSEEAAAIYFEFIFQGIYASPELHARIHNTPELLHGLLKLIIYGFSGSSSL